MLPNLHGTFITPMNFLFYKIRQGTFGLQSPGLDSDFKGLQPLPESSFSRAYDFCPGLPQRLEMRKQLDFSLPPPSFSIAHTPHLSLSLPSLYHDLPGIV